MSDNVERRVAEPGAAEPAVGKARRQRRPTGVPPPLPHPVTISARTWLVLVAVGLAAAFVAAQRTSWLGVDDRVSTWVLRQLAGIRTPWLTDVANGINGAGSGWEASVLGLSVVALAMAFRRWRHLAVFVGGLVFLEVVGELVYNGLSRALAPPRPPIILQRWNSRRVALAAAMLAITAFAAYWTVRAFIAGPVALGADPPRCGTGPAMILSAQAVPSAALLPCIAALPPGWHPDGADIASGHARFWLDSDLAGRAAMTVTLTAACDTAGARQVRSGQPGTQQFERLLSRAPRYFDLRIYTFPGGCVTYQLSFTPGASPTLGGTAGGALSFEARSALVDYVRRTESLVLCGRGAACTG